MGLVTLMVKLPSETPQRPRQHKIKSPWQSLCKNVQGGGNRSHSFINVRKIYPNISLPCFLYNEYFTCITENGHDRTMLAITTFQHIIQDEATTTVSQNPSPSACGPDFSVTRLGNYHLRVLPSIHPCWISFSFQLATYSRHLGCIQESKIPDSRELFSLFLCVFVICRQKRNVLRKRDPHN